MHYLKIADYAKMYGRSLVDIDSNLILGMALNLYLKHYRPSMCGVMILYYIGLIVTGDPENLGFAVESAIVAAQQD